MQGNRRLAIPGGFFIYSNANSPLLMSNTKAHWEQIYSEKTPDQVSWYQKTPEISLQLIKQTGIDKDAAIIDIGGGSSTLVDCLLDNGYTNISVLDISRTALEYAQQRLAQKAVQVTWLVSDITEYHSSSSYDIWHDRAVFHFLTDAEDRKRYITVLKHSLKPNGHVIIAAFAIGGPKQCSGLDIVQYDARKLMMELGEEFELIDQVGEIHRTPTNHEQKYGYFLFGFRP
jgi:2-polyprenyl-3-methyl-5-hydroxy-6-metoxy-1,4-benzoquinol methylase